MSAVAHRYVESNGITMHVAEQGSGPLVVLCHGFPECWYSWRHQLQALAEAGFHAVAPDQRGYGRTSRPEDAGAYNIFQLTGDMVGLVDALGEEKAAIVGHDWGAVVAWHCALLRPDVFRAVGLLSVPFAPRTWTDLRPTEAMRRKAGDREFYQLYFQEPGKAEAAMDQDVRMTLRLAFASRWHILFERGGAFMDKPEGPVELPPWLAEGEFDQFVEEFGGAGFRGGLNWYRNMDYRWEQTPFLSGAKLRQPLLFVAGGADPVVAMMRKDFETLEENAPALRGKVLIPGAGHWIQQESAAEVNRLLVQFLSGLGGRPGLPEG